MSTSLTAVLAGLTLGCVLGLLGGGGGLIAVPLFGALFGWSIDDSGTASMACMLTGSAVAVVTQRSTGRVRWRTGIAFGVLGFAGAVIGSRLAFSVPDLVQHSGLACLLVVSGFLMVRKARRLRGRISAPGLNESAELAFSVRTIGVATAIGFVVGMFGISGGFLTVPALVTVVGVAVPEATATALIVVMINSVVALSARAGHVDHVNITAVLAGSTGLGAVIGALWSRRLSAATLAMAFGVLMYGIAAWEFHAAVQLFSQG